MNTLTARIDISPERYRRDARSYRNLVRRLRYAGERIAEFESAPMAWSYAGRGKFVVYETVPGAANPSMKWKDVVHAVARQMMTTAGTTFLYEITDDHNQ